MHPVILDAVSRCGQNRQWPLYLYGHTGAGKTFAAGLVYSAWKKPAAWWSLEEFCDILKGYNNSHTQLIRRSGGQQIELTLNNLWKWVESAGLIVIDEIGTRQASSQRFDALLRLLDVRRGKPMILTGNIDPKAAIAELYDERVQSRIVGGSIVVLKGQDLRTVDFTKRIRVAE